MPQLTTSEALRGQEPMKISGVDRVPVERPLPAANVGRVPAGFALQQSKQAARGSGYLTRKSPEEESSAILENALPSQDVPDPVPYQSC